jgi:cytochrome c biogenesis protein CcmG/thiol:disulfide interchange protein DsbE
MSRNGVVPIVGLNYKDRREDGKQWLAKFGNPYVLSAYDDEGRVGIDYGVYGVPETFVIDKQGVIRYKQIGPVTPDALEKMILPLIRKLNA